MRRLGLLFFLLLLAPFVYAQQPINSAQIGGSTISTAASGTQLVGLADGSGTKITSNSTTTSGKVGLDMNILSILGTAPTTAGFLDIKGADGNVFVRQATAANLNATVTQVAGNWNDNLAQVNGNTTATCGVNGCLSVGGNIADGSALTANNDPIVIAGKGSGNANVPVVCDGWAPFSLASTTSLKIISNTSGKKTYICSINIVIAGANNVALIAGTKMTNDCDTSTAGLAGGTTAATGWNFAANGGLTQGSGIGVVAATASASLDVCLLASASTQVSGVVSYTKF